MSTAGVLTPATTVEQAYRQCEAITRQQAANFYYGIRLLSLQRRQAMCAVYAFARRIDDIGDDPAPTAQKTLLLQREREALSGLRGGSSDAVMVALADAARRFPLPLDALGELIEGVQMDLDETRYETFEELVLYCRRVAGTIGRLCLAIFGLRDGAGMPPSEHAWALADDLGVALQLTNILRDVREDALGGRVYLPGEDLRRFDLDGPADERPRALLGAIESRDELLTGLVRFEAARARQWFTRGLALADLLDRRSAACLLAMSGIYRRLLERIDDDPSAALRTRMSLPAHEKVWVAARGMIGIRP